MSIECPVCQGKGYLPKDTLNIPSNPLDYCPYCKGRGEVAE